MQYRKFYVCTADKLIHVNVIWHQWSVTSWVRVIPLVRFSYRGVSFNILTTACKQRTPTRKKVSDLQTCRCCRTLNGMYHHDVVYKNGMNWRRRKFFCLLLCMHIDFTSSHEQVHTRENSKGKSQETLLCCELLQIWKSVFDRNVI